MSVDGTLGVEEEMHIFHPRTGRLVPSAARLLRHLPAEAFGAELQRTTVEINSPRHHLAFGSEPRDDPTPPAAARRRPEFRSRRGGSGDGARGHRQRLRAHRARSLQPHARRISAAGRRATDLRLPGARGRGGSGSRGPADQSCRGHAPHPARPLGQLPVLAGTRHRVRQHAHDDLGTVADVGQRRSFRVNRRVRTDGALSRRHRGYQRRQNGLLRRPPVRPRADVGAPGVRRLSVG